MSVTKNFLAYSDFTNKTRYNAKGQLAANAGATNVFPVLVPAGKSAYVKAIVRMSSGQDGPNLTITNIAANGVVTSPAHGLTIASVQSLRIVGATTANQPTGFTAATVYFASIIDANTFAVYDTAAHALAAAGAAGQTGFVSATPVSVSAVATTGNFALTTAAAPATGTAVIIAGSPIPTGITAATVYYAYNIDTTHFTLFATQAQAIAGVLTLGGGQIQQSTSGTTVTYAVVGPAFADLTTAQAFFEIAGVIVNRQGTAQLVGSNTVVDSFKDTEAGSWAAALVADNTTYSGVSYSVGLDTYSPAGLNFAVTPDASLITRWEVVAEVFDFSELVPAAASYPGP
jgi:hypothetical protein